MSTPVTYFPRTTAQQRYLLFETWEVTGSVTAACRQARVTRKVFYTWKPRFEAGGYAALEVPSSHAPKHPPKISAEVTTQVIRLKRAHPTWGKRRIADELAKAQSWVPVVSVNTVKRIVQEADLWPEADGPQKKKYSASGSNRRGTRPESQRRSVFCASNAHGSDPEAAGCQRLLRPSRD
jgi:transposase